MAITIEEREWWTVADDPEELGCDIAYAKADNITQVKYHRENRLIRDILKDLNEALKVQFPDLDRFGSTDWEHQEERFPVRYRWIACYPVTGGSEAHYVHIDLIDSHGARRMIGLCKVWNGWDEAAAVASAAGRMLGA